MTAKEQKELEQLKKFGIEEAQVTEEMKRLLRKSNAFKRAMFVGLAVMLLCAIFVFPGSLALEFAMAAFVIVSSTISTRSLKQLRVLCVRTNPRTSKSVSIRERAQLAATGEDEE